MERESSGQMAFRPRASVTASLLLAFLVIAELEPGARADPLAVVEGEALDVAAEHLEVDVEQGKARLDGAVVMKLGDLEVSCPSVEIKYDRSPRVSWAKGTGGVAARLRGIEATAASVEFDAKNRTVDLRGNVKLSRGRGWITADHATVDVGTGKVALDDVKGSIPVDQARR